MLPIIIIPARFASTRFPGKPLVDINGKSMIMRVYEAALKCTDDVFVATDDERIFNHVADNKGKVIMTDINHKTGTERCNEAYKIISKKLKKKWDVVVNLQGDEPFINPMQISELINLFKNDINIGTQAKVIENIDEIANKNVVKVVFNSSYKALYFSRETIPNNITNTDIKYYKHIGLYAFKPTILEKLCNLNESMLENAESLEQLRWLFYGYDIHISITKYNNIAIDSPEDLDRI